MTEKRKGYRILLTMFETIKKTTRAADRACFNQLVRFLADCARVHPMPKEDHAVADRLVPMIKPLLDAWYDEPYDYLGQLFGEKDCAMDEMGQIITPPWIVSYINDAVMEGLDEEDEDRWKLVLDPCTGTGRFLLDLVWRHRDRKLTLFGVELDLDLYRACLVNMKLHGFGMPYAILRANALIVDLEPNSSNWRFANRWTPANWQTEMVTPSGETYADWRKEHGFGEEPELEQEPGRAAARPQIQVAAEDLPLFRQLGEEKEQ